MSGPSIHPNKLTLLNIHPNGPYRIPPMFLNWAHTFHCDPLAIFEPDSVHECTALLDKARQHGKVLRAVGVGHSPSDLACTTGYMLRTTKLNRLLEVSVDPLIRCTPSHTPGQRRETLRRRRGRHHPRHPPRRAR